MDSMRPNVYRQRIKVIRLRPMRLLLLLLLPALNDDDAAV